MRMKFPVLWAFLSVVPVMSEAQDAPAFKADSFSVAVNYMMPVSYPARLLSYGYVVGLRNDSAFVCLPYMGRVYQPALNDEGLRFALPAADIVTRRTKKGETRVAFTVRKPPIVYKFTVTAYADRRADVILIPSNAQSISYSGDWE